MAATINKNLGGEIIWIRDGARVEVNVSDGSLGNTGATVECNVPVKAGHLWAKGDSSSNRVGSHIICKCGEPRFLATATDTDWDGDEDANDDGTLGGHYKC